MSLIRGTGPSEFNAHNAYADAKMMVALWSGALSRPLPEGMAVNAVSPGAARGTNAARRAGFMMRRVMLPMMKAMPTGFGMTSTVPVAAARYLQGSEFSADVNGQFFASAPKKMAGKLTLLQIDQISDLSNQEAAWDAVVEASLAEYPASA